jgi:hypothetical protein
MNPYYIIVYFYDTAEFCQKKNTVYVFHFVERTTCGTNFLLLENSIVRVGSLQSIDVRW